MIAMIYLDNASTTRLRGEVLEEMLPYMKEKFGNPSNFHSLGREAKESLQKARERVSDLLSSSPSELIFTSSGTEANNLAIKGMAQARKGKGKHMVVSGVEHLAVQHPAVNLQRQGFEVSFAGCDGNGRVSPEKVEEALREDTVLIAVQQANHEVGTLQPVEGIAEVAEDRDIPLHVDATAGAGFSPIDVEEMGVSSLSLTAHRFFGPKGGGALFLATGNRLMPQMEGGIQERGLRAGTEDVPAIVGMGKAAQLAEEELEESRERYLGLRKRFISLIKEAVPEVNINGHPEKVLPHYIHLSLPMEGEVAAQELNERGIIASSGSPCISQASKASHVLRAMGLSTREAQGALLFTMGRETTLEDLEKAAGELQDIVKT